MVAANRVQPFHRMPTVFALIAVLCFGFRLDNLAASPEYSHRAYLFGTHIRIDSLMFGVLLSYLWIFRGLQNRTVRSPSFALIAIGGLLLTPAFAFQLETNKWISIVGVIFFYLGAGVLVIAALRWETSESHAIRLIAGLGAASYSIYLWHMPVATWGHSFVAKLIGYDSYLLYLFNAVIGACACGWVLSRLIENPILKLRDRFFPSQATPRIKVWENECSCGFGQACCRLHEFLTVSAGKRLANPCPRRRPPDYRGRQEMGLGERLAPLKVVQSAHSNRSLRLVARL